MSAPLTVSARPAPAATAARPVVANSAARKARCRGARQTAPRRPENARQPQTLVVTCALAQRRKRRPTPCSPQPRMSDAKIKDANWPAARDLRSQVLAKALVSAASWKAAETDEHRRQSAVRATCGWPDGRVNANFSAERRKHDTPDIGTGGLFPGQARDLEGEAHLGLEAIEEGRGRLRSSARSVPVANPATL